MKVVVDTNVLVAGLLSPFGPPGEILCMVASGTLRLCFDARILTEYEEVLARPKFRFNAEQTQALMDHIQAEGFSVASNPLPVRLPDPSDEPFLQSAVASEADCLITGNIKHFPSARRQGMTILSPREFLDYYRKRSTPRIRKG
ncbi:MAG: putative toxin-antitoxin system toxin component, PIN family [Nitrospira sp.]|nr:MAG: putative toxin-antitoxin system toxin component, PIN family [Nitrospira sp.]